MTVSEEPELNRSFVGLEELRPAQSKNACMHIPYSQKENLCKLAARISSPYNATL